MANVKGKDNYVIMPQIDGTDIVPSGGTTGQALIKDSDASYDYSWGNVSATSATLVDLTDVTVTGVNTGEVISYTGAGWENQTLAEANIAAANRNIIAGTGLTGGGTLTADRTLNVIGANSIAAASNSIALVNDTASPGNNQVYGTNSSGVKGWKADPTGTKRYFDVYDLPGGQTFTTSTITVNLDTIRANSGGGAFTLTSDTITVNNTGVYKVDFRISVGIANGNSRSSSRGRMELNSTELAGSTIYLYHRVANNGWNTGSASMILSLTAGDELRLRINCFTDNGSTLETQAQASGITIVEL